MASYTASRCSRAKRSSSGSLDGQRDQFATITKGIQPVTDHQRTSTQTIAIDALTANEKHIYMADQVQIKFQIAEGQVAGEHFRSR